jgi:para-nitrobenzyl esterase
MTRPTDGPTIATTTTGPTTTTPYGPVRGIDRDGVAVFKGIRYATAARFAPPVPVTGWDGTLDATVYGAHCPQLVGTMERMFGASRIPNDEDCLFLNVFTPGCDDARRPVLVWIHGGAFVTGGSAVPWYDGSALARRGDVVVVTVNYRLGALGFAGDTNAGLADQVAALRWVHEAISSFGGDPERVTVFGESAGGASVVALMASPATRGLFAQAWAMSPSIPQFRSAARGAEAQAELLDAAGARSLGELAQRPVDDVLAAQGAVLADLSRSLTAFAPTPDDVLLPVGPEPGSIAAAAARDPRPLVVGTTRDESHLFTAFDPKLAELDDAGLHRRYESRFADATSLAVEAYRRHRSDHTNGQLVSAMQTDETFRVPARRLAEGREAAGADTWMYWFTFPTPVFGGVLGACHALDIPYAFHNLSRTGVELFTGTGAEREHVADRFADAVLRFARHGDPGWDGYDTTRRRTRRLHVEHDTIADPEPELRELWAGV